MATWCYSKGMTTTNDIRVVGYFDADTARRLRVMAAERNVKVTHLLREAVRQYLKSQEVK